MPKRKRGKKFPGEEKQWFIIAKEGDLETREILVDYFTHKGISIASIKMPDGECRELWPCLSSNDVKNIINSASGRQFTVETFSRKGAAGKIIRDNSLFKVVKKRGSIRSVRRMVEKVAPASRLRPPPLLPPRPQP